MESLRSLADQSIRRPLGLAALGILLAVLPLIAVPVLALRVAAGLTALVFLALWYAAARLAHRDIRETALWRLLSGTVGPRDLLSAGFRRRAREVLRERLMWHAGRAGLAAIGLWGASLIPGGLGLIRV